MKEYFVQLTVINMHLKYSPLFGWGEDRGVQLSSHFHFRKKNNSKNNQALAGYSPVFCSCHAGIAVLVNSSYNERCNDFQFLSFFMIVQTLGITEKSSDKCLPKGETNHKNQCCHCKLYQEKSISLPSLHQWSAAPE